MSKAGIKEKLPSMFAAGFTYSRDRDLFVDDRWKLEGVTNQFIEDADTYHQHYFDRLNFLDLTDRCLTLSNVDFEQNLTVLDIGSGGGSSVFAAAEILKNAEIVASDISPQLLRKFTTVVEEKADLSDRLAAVCFDLHYQVFKDCQFDLIVGMAILHHLVDPLAALKNVAKSLKVGGQMILVEPLEAGHLMLYTLYDQILLILRRLNKSEGQLAALISALRLDYQARMGVPDVQGYTQFLDDKWIFGEAYLEGLGHELGLASIEVHPAQSSMESIFETSFMSLLADSGNSDIEVPEEVLETIRAFDRGIGKELKNRLSPTGIIVMTKHSSELPSDTRAGSEAVLSAQLG
jgi:SAM-dependent methyltransferase